MGKDFTRLFVPRDLISNYGAKTACQISALYYNVFLEDRDSVIRRLKKIGLLEFREYNPSDVKEILTKKNLINTGIGFERCSWCQTNTYTLHEHHFPIYKADGGLKTVNICPNCHQEFHTLMTKLNFKINDSILSLFPNTIEWTIL